MHKLTEWSHCIVSEVFFDKVPHKLRCMLEALQDTDEMYSIRQS